MVLKERNTNEALWLSSAKGSFKPPLTGVSVRVRDAGAHPQPAILLLAALSDESQRCGGRSLTIAVAVTLTAGGTWGLTSPTKRF